MTKTNEAACEVSARVCAPAFGFTTTFANAYQPAELADRQLQMACSLGAVCGDCVCFLHEGLQLRDSEFIRLASSQRCRCGNPTRFYHLADAERTAACKKDFGG